MEEKILEGEEKNQAMEQFRRFDEKIDSKLGMEKKILMKISDVSESDARWWKDFCDRHTDKKQFLGIKVIRSVMENMEPLVQNILSQLTTLNESVGKLSDRISAIENKLSEPKPSVPKTMGANRNGNRT